MASVYRKEGESLDQMLRRFKRRAMEEGRLLDLKEHEYYKSKGQKRREKRKESERRAYINELKMVM